MRSGHDHLVCVEVPVDAARVWLRRSRPEAVAGVQQPLDAHFPPRLRARHGRQTLVQDAHLVGHRVATLGRYAGPVEFVRRLGDPAYEVLAARRRQKVGCDLAPHFALQPHPELWHDPYRLGYGDAVRAVGPEARVPERAEEPVAGLAGP